MKKILADPFVFICLAAFLFFGISFISSLWENSPYSIFQSIQESYIKGEESKNKSERVEAFNKALELQINLEKHYAPTFGNGILYFNIGNTLLQLEQYPLALLYYYRAEKLRPRDQNVQAHIEITENKLQITPAKSDSLGDWLFHSRIALPESLQLFFACGILLLILYSCYIWFPSGWLKLGMGVLSIPAILLALSLIYTYVFSSIDAILIKPSQLYRDGGFQYAVVQREPLLAGIKVRVLSETGAGKWLQVRTESGIVGYIPQEAIRII